MFEGDRSSINIFNLDPKSVLFTSRWKNEGVFL